MKTVEIIKQTSMAGTTYKRGEIVTIRARTADAIVARGDGWYRGDKPRPKPAPSLTPAQAAEKEQSDRDAFREKAIAALAEAGAHVDARWGVDRLKRELKQHKIRV